MSAISTLSPDDRSVIALAAGMLRGLAMLLDASDEAGSFRQRMAWNLSDQLARIADVTLDEEARAGEGRAP